MHARDCERACIGGERRHKRWGEKKRWNSFFLFSSPLSTSTLNPPPPKKKPSTQTEELLIKRRALLEKKIEAEQGKAGSRQRSRTSEVSHIYESEGERAGEEGKIITHHLWRSFLPPYHHRFFSSFPFPLSKTSPPPANSRPHGAQEEEDVRDPARAGREQHPPRQRAADDAGEPAHDRRDRLGACATRRRPPRPR